MRFLAIGVAAALALGGIPAGAVQAKVVDATANGFQVTNTVVVKAAPDKVWAAMARPGLWWNRQHTWWGDPSKLSLDLKPDGCFCEAGPNGAGAAHLKVIFVDPGKTVRLWGALGPLSTFGVTGGMTWGLKAVEGGTEVTWTYIVGGYMPGGVDKIAGPVDGVLLEQMTRLGRYVETGKAD